MVCPAPLAREDLPGRYRCPPRGRRVARSCAERFVGPFTFRDEIDIRIRGSVVPASRSGPWPGARWRLAGFRGRCASGPGPGPGNPPFRAGIRPARTRRICAAESGPTDGQETLLAQQRQEGLDPPRRPSRAGRRRARRGADRRRGGNRGGLMYRRLGDEQGAGGRGRRARFRRQPRMSRTFTNQVRQRWHSGAVGEEQHRDVLEIGASQRRRTAGALDPALTQSGAT